MILIPALTKIVLNIVVVVCVNYLYNVAVYL